MGQISLSIPQSGQPNSTEDPKIASDLTTIQTAINGNLDTGNLSPTAAIKYSQLAPGTWTSLTLGGGVIAFAGAYVPAARLEGDVVRLRGVIQNNSGGTIATGSTVFTIPSSSMFPAHTAFFSLASVGGGGSAGVFLTVATSGVVSLSSSSGGWSAVQTVLSLDGLHYMVS